MKSINEIIKEIHTWVSDELQKIREHQIDQASMLNEVASQIDILKDSYKILDKHIKRTEEATKDV